MLRSKRLLALARDERLVDQIRRGNELAFEVAFERHGAGILAFCRHMLGSREEAEDVVQHTFAAAYRDLQRSSERSIALKAWLYTIARNRCVSVLRARRELATELHELPTEGLSEQVEQRAELRDLLADVRELPEDQRAALLLAEAAGLSHAEVAEVLGCKEASVRGIVFRARSSLIERRSARETPCHEIREQLATLRGGALRRNELRHHLRQCPGCSAYRDEVRRQRKMLAVALPVAPSLGLKSSVMGAAGLTGGAAAGASAGGGLALGSAALAKVARRRRARRRQRRGGRGGGRARRRRATARCSGRPRRTGRAARPRRRWWRPGPRRCARAARTASRSRPSAITASVAPSAAPRARTGTGTRARRRAHTRTRPADAGSGRTSARAARPPSRAAAACRAAEQAKQPRVKPVTQSRPGAAAAGGAEADRAR